MKRFDFLLLISVVILTLFGLLMIFDASSYNAFKDFGDKYHYIRDQFLWLALGFAGLTFFSFFDYHRLYNFALPLLALAIGFLVLVFMPGLGVEIMGARRWIRTGFFLFQPAEFVKLAFSIYLAAWFSTKEKGRLKAFIAIVGLIFFLVIMEPDMGTAGIILFEALSIYFLSGGSMKHFSYMVPAVSFLGFLLIKIEPYRAKRLSTFFNFNQSLDGSSYHVRQILISLGMGGFTGVGLGNSLQKYAYLPENTTDSIFAIIAEELGFMGSFILILLFVFVVLRGFMIATKARDTFGKLLAGGIISFIAIQTIINLGAQTVMIPLTGVPLPFISYGGSALVVDLCSIGILLNISKQTA